MVFNKQYSDLYDQFYQDKDYSSECDLIEKVFKKYNQSPQRILDLGCGTGGHALTLAERGYRVTGIDRSDHMLKIARKKAARQNSAVEFLQQDISKLDLKSNFDAVISMFAVIGYLSTNECLEQAFAKIFQLLENTSGIFIFDCWYGPAVLKEQPESRIKNFANAENKRILRLVIPEMDELNHVVKVNYQIMHIDGNQILSKTKETHNMRFFFPREIEFFLKKAGFTEVNIFPFNNITGKLTMTDWNMLVVAR